jgi:hypothetical protein
MYLHDHYSSPNLSKCVHLCFSITNLYGLHKSFFFSSELDRINAYLKVHLLYLNIPTIH